MKALYFLYSTITELFLYIILLRLIMVVAGISVYDPLARFVYALTDPLFRPIQQLLPRGRAFKTSAIVLTLMFALLWALVMRWLPTLVFACQDLSITQWSINSALLVLNAALRLYWFLLLIYVIFSWIDPMGMRPLAATLGQLCQPLLKPVRRLVPAIGGIDISPLIPFLIIGALMVQFPPPPLVCAVLN